MAFDLALILGCIILPILTAVSGAWQAKQKGETINWAIFVKTIIIGVITAGLITQVEGDLIVAIASTEIVTVALDWVVNAIVNKTAKTTPTTTPTT